MVWTKLKIHKRNDGQTKASALSAEEKSKLVEEHTNQEESFGEPLVLSIWCTQSSVRSAVLKQIYSKVYILNSYTG
jgi:hypothetical protein